MKQKFLHIITFIITVFFLVQCSEDVEVIEQEQSDRFEIEDFIAVEGDTLFLNTLSAYATNCRLSSQGDTEFFRIDVLGIDTLMLGSKVIANKFRLGFQGGIPESKVWEVQHLPKGNPDTWNAEFATVLMDIDSEDCENMNLIALEGKVETKREGDELLIYIDEVLMIDHEKENDDTCEFRISGKFSCEL